MSGAGGRASLQTLLQETDFSLASLLLSVLGEGTFLSLLSFLERHALLKDWAPLVSVRTPFAAARSDDLPVSGFDIEDLSDVVSDIEPARAGVPVLLRQYLKLGGKLLGFNVDPNFSNALDGLILVDLTKTGPKLLERYLGKDEAAKFLAFHKG